MSALGKTGKIGGVALCASGALTAAGTNLSAFNTATAFLGGPAVAIGVGATAVAVGILADSGPIQD